MLLLGLTVNNPTFLLQSGQIMAAEKTACCFSNYPIEYCKYEDLYKKEDRKLKYVPVGSVEFVERYCSVVGIDLPVPLSYPDPALPFMDRALSVKRYEDADDEEFIKPVDKVKLFTGCVKKDLAEQGIIIDGNERVWTSEKVPFESEFRFYIHDFVTGPRVVGWSRYDDLEVSNPEPDIGMVESIANEYHEQIGPGAYSIDIGWRSDLNKYSLVELNDGWALGYYSSDDPQSNPPTRQQYADMLVSRWTQILFCSVLDRETRFCN